ncbi:hypothetical protein chiPu_0030164 [Chiloscyllium punctatum]|uniref:Uncharacterized protein n=1 Tax=Chiloscyllium punctatum TaxID=137246 RepID=A0A401TU30_CHIPU|nr:hypothetical protein [Chiloscyllium punctatum]
MVTGPRLPVAAVSPGEAAVSLMRGEATHIAASVRAVKEVAAEGGRAVVAGLQAPGPVQASPSSPGSGPLPLPLHHRRRAAGEAAAGPHALRRAADTARGAQEGGAGVQRVPGPDDVVLHRAQLGLTAAPGLGLRAPASAGSPLPLPGLGSGPPQAHAGRQQPVGQRPRPGHGSQRRPSNNSAAHGPAQGPPPWA